MKLGNIANVLRAAGLKVVEVGGWQNRGFLGQDLIDVRGVLWHHTVGSRASFATQNMPSLSVLVNGRTGLAGPLAQLGLGRDGTFYVVAAGLCNHAGRGSAPGIPTDAGNYYLIGIEMESSGLAPWDWTPAQIRAAAIGGAALERAYLQDQPESLRLQLGHKEYSSEGKIDPAGWPGDMDGLRASINAVLAGGTPKPPQKDELDMATPKEVADEIFGRVFTRQGPGVSGQTNFGATVAWLDANLSGISGRIAAQDATIKNLVGAVNALANGEAFDEAKLLAGIQASTEAGVKKAIESITTTVNLSNPAE